MSRSLVLVGLGLLMLMALPSRSLAATATLHYFDCKQCHKAGMAITAMGANNVCLDCHSTTGTFTDSTPAPAAWYDGTPNTRYNALSDQNDLFGAATAALGAGSYTGQSHGWGVSDVRAAAGAKAPDKTNPLYAGFYSRYNASTGKVTCSRCHNPHGDADLGDGNILANPKLLIRNALNSNAPMQPEVMCRACHVDFDKPIGSTANTHPMVPDYAAVQAAKSSQYKTPAQVAAVAGASKAQLVNGGVGCTSCHGAHFTDNDATTADGMANRLGLSNSPGELLRADGPLRTGTTRNGAAGTAQLRSNLCQTCHTYKMHGKGTVGDAQVGCLECHNAHDYSNSNAFGLRVGTSATSLPTRSVTNNGSTKTSLAPSTVTFASYASGAFSRSKWTDNVVGTATGYCERCHGDTENIAGVGGIELEHHKDAINPCTACHKHNDPASIHSFNIDANAATCGQCHGFPPYLNAAGDRDTGGTDGGYARNEVDGTPYDYAGRSYFKDETQTAHKTHAGAALSGNPGTWYFVGASGIENCMPCHGNGAGTGGGGHRIAPTTDADTFRNINFNQYGTGNGNYSPLYNPTTAKCSSTYCHSNGAPRTGDSTRNYTVSATTPAWVGNGTTDGFTSIQGKGTRCQFCHGNDATSMGAKSNSARHTVHLNKGYSCEVCHVQTAASATALTAAAVDGRSGGEHINLVANVDYKTSGTPLSVAMATNNVGPTYNTTTGTCSIYCHDPQDVGATADWDSTAAMQCDSCHKGLLTDTTADGGLGPITSGSHLRHVSDATGPKLGCDECHGPGSSTGSHSGMLDGTVVVVAGVCNTCHAVDGGEVVPVWGQPATMTCVSCHTGATTTAAGIFTTAAAPSFPNFFTTGHGKPSGTYTATNLPAANKACTECHGNDSPTHFDNIAGNDKVLLPGFTCEGCHDGTPATAVQTHSNTNPAYTNQKRTDFTKLCLACHTPHGSGNLAMIAPTKPDFGGTVAFTSFGNASPVANDNSFDESADSPASNLDDICATCHTATAHNNRAMAGSHNEGKTCITCHSHNGIYGGFMPTGGNACNDCHGNPPATGAHAKHNTVTTHDLLEDRTDCANCHTGADSYTMAAGGLHQNSTVNVAVGWSNNGTPLDKTDDTCATACHNSTAGDGKWGDANGLDCNSCHYYSATPTSAGNAANGASEAIGAMAHNKHFDKSKLCSDCHSVENGGASIAGPLVHITDKTGANEGAKFTGMAAAVQDEAAVVRSGMTFDDNLNTCSGGIGLGCHATGTPDWDVTIPATGCTQCHTDTTTSAVNPTSALHSATPTVTGKKHSTGFTYNAGASTADCTTCHTSAPTVTGTDHMNGVLDASIGSVAAPQKITLVAGLGFTDAVTPTCAVSTTGCHSRGNGWSYKWHTNAAATNGTQCDGCHGLWSNWTTGVINHRTGSEAETVHGTGATYKCRDCHGLEAASGYPFANTTNDWKATDGGATTLHGDGVININTAGTTGYSRGTYGGCTGCHSNSDGTAAGQHAFAITTWTLSTITADAITSSCSSCHGGATTGVSKNNYWPDGANTLGDNGTADNSGEHAVHIQKLAAKVYGETATGAADNDILRDNTTLNPALTSDAKQKELCSYCHTTPGADGDHGVTYPADVNSMYTLWSKTLDNGALTPATGSCATVDCHNNVTTAAGYYWYAGGTSACAMCHTNGASDTTHTAHLTGTYGKTIDCLSCHGAGTTSTTAPTADHINGTLAVAGSVTFTYTGGLTGTCGTNACHNDGTGNTPYSSGAALGAYNWGTPLTNCTACHNNPNSTGNGGARHTKHMANTTYVSGGCNECHPAATATSHIDGTRNATGAKQTVYTSANGTCTNTCHTATIANGVWTDALALPCVNCHQAGTYVGSGANLPASGLHNVTVALKHDATLQSGNCINCHSTTPTSVATNHINGTLQNATAITYAWNANVTAYVPATGCQAVGTCHSDGGDWRRKWSGVTDAKPGAANNPGDAVCGNCHGDYGTGWRWNEANATTTDHTDPNGDLTDQMASNHGTCLNCHGWGNGSYDKTWGTGKHGDGLITMNGPTGTGSGYTDGTGGCAQSCHGDIAGRRMNSNSGWTANYGDYGAGSCFSCHGNGTNQYWPDGSTYPDKAGRHSLHITRIAGKLGITLPGTDLEQKRMCAYCHNDASGIGGSGHNTDNAPTGVADVGAINPIWDATNPPTVADAGASFNTTDGSCASIDCHNNKTLPAGSFGWRDATATTCTMCHTPGGASNDPTSGLHNLTPTVSGQRHDNTITGGCAACHGTIPTPGSSTHVNGAFTGNGTVAGDKTNMGLIAAYTATADGTGSCLGSPTGNAGCHSGAGDAGTWARKWDSTISGQSNGTECKGCHGGFASDWTFGATHNTTDGSTEHTYSWDGDGSVEIVGNHKDNLANTSRCNVCHVYGDAGYVFGTNHRNGSLEMNSTRGYSDVSFNCTSSCHINNTNHNLEDSGWTIAPVAGPALACDSCHGGSGQYWPNMASTAAGDYPNRKGRHDIHMTRLAAKLGYTLPGSDAQQKAMCGYCHNDASGQGGTGHDDRVAPANLGNFKVIWNAGADANGAYTSTAPGTCSNIDCHNSQATTAGTFGWYDSGTSACLLCHNLGGTGNNPTSGLHRVTPTITGAAGTHDDAFGSGGSCTSCHTSLPAMSPSSTHPDGTFSSNGTLAGDRTNMGLFAAYTTSGTDNTGSCSGALVGGVGCHAGAGDAGTWARQWNSANATATTGNECKGCHGGFAGTDWTFGAVHNTGDTTTEHQYNWDGDANPSEVIGNHKDNAANATRCNVCHVYADAPYTTGAFATYHRNGTIEMNTVVEYSTTNKNCTGACHAANNANHNLDASGWTVNPIAGPAMACSSCHGGGTTQGGGLFNYWPDGTVYPDKEGTPNRHLVHINRLATKLGYTMGALTDAQQKTMCGYCHNDPAGVGGTGHGDATSPANVGSFKFIGTGLADGGTAGTYNSTAPGTCSNIDCHNNKLTTAGTYGWANTGTSACLMCHTLGGASNDPTSGLHNVVPTITGQTHDDSFATGGTCTSCHTTMPTVASTHINGTFTGNGTIAGDKTAMGLFAAYTATADNIGTCSGALVGGASCHANIMDAGSWARKWDASIPGQTNGTECQGCHGGMSGNDWTFGNDGVTGDNSTSHNRNWDGDGNTNEVYGNHKDSASNATKCNICHVYADAPYTVGAFATYHRNGKITMNSATTYSGTTWNCTQVCHVNNTNHNLEASASAAWATRGELVAGPALACYTCHGGGTANSGSGFNYWPDGTTYPDTAGGSGTNRHLAHITKLAAKLNYTMATLTDQQQKTMCAYCHPYTTNPGESGHNDNVSPADVTSAAFNPLWSTLTANYPSTADGGTAATWTTGTQQCSGIDCHNNQATTGTWAWNSTATSSCLLCHTLGGAGSNPSSGLHNVTPTVSGQRHDDSFGTGGTCTSCHTTLPATGPTSTHINGTFTGNGTIAGDKTNMGLFAAYTATADNIGTCSGGGVATAACHGDGTAAFQKGDAGTWKRLWDSTKNAGTGGAECQNCHGGFSGTDWTFGVTSGAANTGDTTTDHMANYDGDGASNEINGQHSGTTQTTRCVNCHVYGDTNYVWATNHRNNVIEVNSATGMTTVNRTCTTYCHVDNTGHVLDAGGWTVATLSSPVVCTTCHAGITTHTDADGPGTTYPTAGGNFCLDCHTSHASETYRTGVNASNNVYISTISARVVVGGGNDTGTPIPTMDDQYASHDSYIQLGGTATASYAKSTEAEICWACHDAVTNSNYTLSGVSVTFTNTSATVGTIDATGIGNKFAVGRWITIAGSTVAANNRTFKVATSTANSITVTINTGDGPLSTVTNASGVTIISPISEWQVNEKAATGTLPYNYGMLFTDASTVPGTRTSNWTTGFWRSGKGQQGGSAYNPAWYKRGAIQSTHSANIGGTFTAAVSAGNSLGFNRTETLDAVANIRCSYCHDVHGTHDGVNGDTAGSPYLRGTWKGNPYNEDMAPQYGMSNWTIQGNYNLVPRASTSTTNSGLATVAKAGAYWIDQNSGSPNSGLSSTATAGLCDQCHGTTKNGTWTAAEIGTIDQVGSEGLWVSGYNGHANAVLTGSGAENGSAPVAAGAEIRARNIFTRTKRGSADATDAKATQATMNMGAVSATQGYSYRGAGSGYIWYPRAMNTTELGTTAGRPFAFNNFAWSGATPALTQQGIGTETAHDGQTKFHDFNCAKCHNPHASRLPKLMITNCLDANHNTWQDKSTFTGNGLPSPWTGVRHSQWATAQNCHRLDSRAVLSSGQVTTLGTGWNKATPWLENASPNTTRASDPNP